jgi:hypothetical protein
MTIEIAPPAAKAKVAPSKVPSGTNAKPGSAESGQSAKLPGFLAILAAADESTSGGLALGDGNGSDSALVPPGAVVEPAAPGTAKDDATDALALLTQALQWAANPMGVPSQPVLDAENRKGNENEIGIGIGIGAAARIDPAIVFATVPGPSIGATAKASSPAVKTAVVAADAALNSVPVAVQGQAVSEAIGLPRKANKDVKDTAALQSATVTKVGNPAVEAGRADDRSMKFMAYDMLLKPDLAKAEPVLQMVAGTAKREEQSIHVAAKANAALDVATSWGGTGGAVGGSAVYSAAPVADASALTSAYVAEQVSYWISNDVQSAEMKLQGLGDSPVEVRISMVGNEAHVAFRTDEPQARDALENASAHLKEMLQRDGVVLSGVSVGTSGSGGAGGQEQPPRQGRQKAAVMVEEPTRGETRAWGKAQTGRALDLFV